MSRGAGVATFASLSIATGQKLAVWNWAGTLWTANGTDQLLFSTGTAGTNFPDVPVYSGSDSGAIGCGARFLNNGGNVELVSIPKTGALAAAGMLLSSIGRRGRRAAMRNHRQAV